MDDILLNMIKDDLSTEEICQTLNIDKRQLKQKIEQLKISGFNIENKMYFDGTDKYALCHTINPTVDLKLYAKSKEEYFKALVIGDTHIGHKKENIDYIYTMYDYCLAKDINLKYIIHLGDILEGTADSKIPLREQLEYFIEQYPYENNIKNILLFGNHEEPFVTEEAIDLKSYIEDKREDMLCLGFGQRNIELDNKYGHIFMMHQGNIISNSPGIRLFAHSHRFKYVVKQNYPIITVPTLSDKQHTTDLPGAVEIEITRQNDSQNVLLTNHLVIPEKQKVKNISRIQQTLKRI